MVRENDELSKSTGFDQDKGVKLNETLTKEGKATYDTQYPEGEPTKEPIDIKGDIVPDKKG